MSIVLIEMQHKQGLSQEYKLFGNPMSAVAFQTCRLMAECVTHNVYSMCYLGVFLCINK